MLLLAGPCVVLVEVAEVIIWSQRQAPGPAAPRPVRGPGRRRAVPARAPPTTRTTHSASTDGRSSAPSSLDIHRRARPNGTPQFRERQADPEFTSFRELYDFDFDDFQVAACGALTAGHGVLVAAPTGSGKTVVGEFAVHLALAQGRKCFYTTPIKALSNQKYTDLVRRYDQPHGRPADRRQQRQRRRAGRGDDHRGAAEHAVRRLAHADGPRLRRPRRGALPGRPLPRRGLGRGDHPPARVGAGGRRCPRRSATPRSSATGWPRCAAAPRSSSTSTGRCRCGSTCWPGAGCTTCSPTTSTPGQPRADPDGAARRRLARQAPPGRPGRRAAPARAGSPPPYRPEVDRPAGRRRACCPRSRSSSAGPAATRPSSSAWPPGCG